jgi:hypothetical protein
MPEEKKGTLKFTMEFEANEMFMDLMKEAMMKMPEMMAKRAEMMASKTVAEKAEK